MIITPYHIWGGGGGNTATLVNDNGVTVLSTENASPAQGLSFPYDSKYDIHTNDFLIQFVYKIPSNISNNTPTGYGVVIGTNNNGGFHFCIGPNTVYLWRGYVSPNDMQIAWSGFPTDNEYHTYKITRISGTVTFSVDNVIEFTTTNNIDYTFPNNGDDIGIFGQASGNRGTGSHPLLGYFKNFTFAIGDVDVKKILNNIIVEN